VIDDVTTLRPRKRPFYFFAEPLRTGHDKPLVITRKRLMSEILKALLDRGAFDENNHFDARA